MTTGGGDGSGGARRPLQGVAAAATAFYLAALATVVLWVAVPAAALGWRPHVIVSGSMSPVVSPGDIVLAEPYDGQGLAPGRVIVFEDAAVPGRLVTHRIEEALPDGGYLTKGDANRDRDRLPVPSESVVGVARVVVPMAALPVRWLDTRELVPMAAWLGLTATAVIAARPRRRRRRSASLATVACAVLVAGVVAPAWIAAPPAAASFTGGSSNDGNAVTAATLDPPTGVTATAGCNLLLLPKITVSWTASSLGDGYRVMRSTKAGGPYSQVATTASTTYDDTNVTAGTRYYYVIQATTSLWTSPYSSEVTAVAPLACL